MVKFTSSFWFPRISFKILFLFVIIRVSPGLPDEVTNRQDIKIIKVNINIYSPSHSKSMQYNAVSMLLSFPPDDETLLVGVGICFWIQ